MVRSALRKKFLSVITFFSICFANASSAAYLHKATLPNPPPIPPVNTADFKSYVQREHTFPSPYGFEPYRDVNRNPITYLLSNLNPYPYIPVTFYCNSYIQCPSSVLMTSDLVTFIYPDSHYQLLSVKGSDEQNRAVFGFYFPKDPQVYIRNVGYKDLGKNLKKGESLVTILFSQKVLQNLSQTVNGSFKGNFAVNEKDINLPLSDGKEYLELGTTLSVIGLGEASGVEFSETVSQTTGETYTTQVQTGFTVGITLENDITVGGGVVPVSDSFKIAVNTTLSSMVTNGLEIADQNTVSRTYTIKPGINDTYYWAIYQLLYSYRIHAPLLEQVLKQVSSGWDGSIGFRMGDNQSTQDGKLIGNPLPPQAPNHVNDITVGVAVPMSSSAKMFVQKLHAG